MSEPVSAPIRAEEAALGSGMIEGLAGIAIAVLTILGLTDILPDVLAAVAVIVAGVALAALGAAVIARFAEASASDGGGIGVEILGGMIAVVLGILALLDVARLILVAVAVIVIGASLLLGSRLGAAVGATREASLATAAVQALVGVAVVTLGILALAGIQAEILLLVALLAFAGAILLSSAVITGRMMTLVRP